MENKIENFVKNNTKWIAAFFFAIVVLYFDSKYVPIEKYETLKTLVSTLETKEVVSELKEEINEIEKSIDDGGDLIQANLVELEDVSDRLEKKIKMMGDLEDLIDKVHEEIDVVENDLIKVKTIQELMK